MKHDIPQVDVDGWIASNGLKIPKDGHFIHGRVRGRIKRGVFEDHMVAPALALVQDGDRVLELGSGIGYVTASVMNARAVENYQCIEANADALAYAEAMLATNGHLNVGLAHGVLGQRRGKRAFFLRRPFLRSSVFKVENKASVRVVVPMHNAKAIFRTVTPNVLICDIEGHEARVLPWADLSGLDRALISLNPDVTGQAGVAAVFAAMAKAGLVYDTTQSKGNVVVFRKLDMAA